MSRRIGLTGGIGSGKSAVAELLTRHGAVVIDSDQVARDVVGIGTPGLAAVATRFGDGVLAPDGSLDRAWLGRLVFSDAAARRDLEAIVHPLVRRRAAQLADAAPAGAVVVQMIPLLVETGQTDSFDLVVVVDAAPDVQVARVCSRDGLSPDEVLARIGAQASGEERLAVADVVIENNGSLQDLEAAVDRLWPSLL